MVAPTHISEQVARLEVLYQNSLEAHQSLQRRYRTMSDDLDKARRTNNERVATIAGLEKENDALMKITERHMGEKRSLASQLNVLALREETLANKHAKLKRTYEMLKKDHASISRVNQRMDDEAGVLETTIEELRQLVTTWESRVDGMTLEIGRLKDQQHSQFLKVRAKETR